MTPRAISRIVVAARNSHDGIAPDVGGWVGGPVDANAVCPMGDGDGASPTGAGASAATGVGVADGDEIGDAIGG